MSNFAYSNGGAKVSFGKREPNNAAWRSSRRVADKQHRAGEFASGQFREKNTPTPYGVEAPANTKPTENQESVEFLTDTYFQPFDEDTSEVAAEKGNLLSGLLGLFK